MNIMPRLGLLNILIGFSWIALAASGGVFVANEITYRFLENISVQPWKEIISAASHGHSALFGLVQIVFGLSLSYSTLSIRWKKIQTIGLCCGLLGMGPLMMIRAYIGPTPGYDWNGIILGGLLSVWLLAIISHIFGLGAKMVSK